MLNIHIDVSVVLIPEGIVNHSATAKKIATAVPQDAVMLILALFSCLNPKCRALIIAHEFMAT